MRAWMLGIAVAVSPWVALAQGQKGATTKGNPPTGKSAAPAVSKDKLAGDKGASAKTPDPAMEKILTGWEAKSKGIRDIECKFRRVTKDAVFKTEETEYGEAWGIKPYQGRLDLKDSSGKRSEIFIYTGKRLYQYDFKSKQETIHILPDPDPNQSMPGPLAFVYGLSATEAKARFDMKLIKQFAVDGADYAEIHATPKSEIDQQDYSFARIVIDLRTYLPKELKLVEPNGNEQHWMFDRIETNLKPPVSPKTVEPFDRNEIKELKSWKQVTNNFGEQPANADAPKPKSAPPSKSATPPKTAESNRIPPKR
jgi:TIGR03009 family protein